jgi:hypothetical protein
MMSSISLYLCSTIWDYLDRFQWSRKVARRRAIERNEDLRGKWVGYCLQFTSDQLVFIDESAAYERTADRKYGWSPIVSNVRHFQASNAVNGGVCYLHWMPTDTLHGSYTKVALPQVSSLTLYMIRYCPSVSHFLASDQYLSWIMLQSITVKR